MTAIAAGHPDPQRFTEQAKAALFPDRMQEAKSILGPHGPLRSFELMEERTEGKQRVRSYKAAWKDLILRCSFTLTKEGQIDALLSRRREVEASIESFIKVISDELEHARQSEPNEPSQSADGALASTG